MEPAPARRETLAVRLHEVPEAELDRIIRGGEAFRDGNFDNGFDNAFDNAFDNS